MTDLVVSKNIQSATKRSVIIVAKGGSLAINTQTSSGRHFVTLTICVCSLNTAFCAGVVRLNITSEHDVAFVFLELLLQLRVLEEAQDPSM